MKIKGILFAGLIVFGLTNLNAAPSEDELIVRALHFEISNPEEAAKVWKKLYELTKKDDYIVEYFNSSLKFRDIKDVIAELKELLKKEKSQELYNLLASLYVKDGNNASAIDILSKDTSILDTDSLYRLAYLYSLANRDNDALKIYEKIYAKEKSWDALKGVLSVIAKKNEANEVVDRLWSELNSNDKLPEDAYLIFASLIDYKKDTIRAIYVYQKLYEMTNKQEYLKQLISLYLYKKDNKNLIKLLTKTNYDNKLLFEIYTSMQKYDKAYLLADKLYKQTNDAKYIAEKAILTYELANQYKSVDKKTIDEMSKLFEKAFGKGVDEAMYYNYYGYILIEHDINLKKGVELIKLALKKEPNNIYFLDSLAWGEYKLKKCDDAKKVVTKMKSIDKIDESDINKHIKTIENCNI